MVEYVDAHILAVNRRHAKKFSSAFAEEVEGDDKGRGYEDFKEVVKDIEAIADVLWVSGTRTIRPFLLFFFPVCLWLLARLLRLRFLSPYKISILLC